jgi:hypothetical protein
MNRCLALAFLMCAVPAFAVDIEIRYGALEKLIGEQAFTAEGKRYVQGTKDQKCRFAFLEKPQLSGAGDRLLLKVNFSGKTALDMFGHCVGVGDQFELTIIAKPFVDNGVIAFDQFQVSTPRDSFYIRRVRNALVDTLNKQFRIDIMSQARKLVEAPQRVGVYTQEIKDLKLTGVRVAMDSLVLGVDFKVIVK